MYSFFDFSLRKTKLIWRKSLELQNEYWLFGKFYHFVEKVSPYMIVENTWNNNPPMVDRLPSKMLKSI